MKKVVSLLLAAVMCLSLCACGTVGTNSTKVKNSFLAGSNSEDGGFIVPMLPGKYTTKEVGDGNNVRWAAVTPDRNNVVYINNDGSLYVVGSEATEAEKVAEDVGEVVRLTDAGVVYYDSNSEDAYGYYDVGIFYRYTFADKEVVKLGLLLDAKFADDALDTAYLVIDGIDDVKDLDDIKNVKVTVRLLNADSTEPIGLSSISLSKLYDASLMAISENGDKLVWSETQSKSSGTRIYIYADGETDTLCSVDGSVGNVQYNDDLSLITIADKTNNILYVGINGEIEKYKLGNSIAEYKDIYTEKGKISDSTSAIDGLYVSCNNDGRYDLYWLNMDGDRERVAENLSNCIIDNGKILYTDEEDRLYSAKISGAAITDETKIAGDVSNFSVATDKKTIYYYKDVGGNDVWSLYVYTGSGEPQKISAAAAGKYSPKFYISSDAQSVFYFTDLENVGSSEYTYKGTLMKYSVKDKESVKIASEVLTNSLKDGRKYDVNNIIDGGNFIYGKYVAVDGNDIVSNWFLFNGKESEMIAKNLTTASSDKAAAAAEAAPASSNKAAPAAEAA